MTLTFHAMFINKNHKTKTLFPGVNKRASGFSATKKIIINDRSDELIQKLKERTFTLPENPS